MKTIYIENFGDGMANDYTDGNSGEFSVSKQFDILTYPTRLQPMRGMTTESGITNLKIGNITVGSNGLMYGVGVDYPGNPTIGELYYRPSYGVDTWQAIPTTAQISGAVLRDVNYSDSDYPFLLDYPDFGNVRTMLWASTQLLVASDPAGGSSTITQALSFSSISQGFIHPKDKRLYFGYGSGSNTYIGRISSNATPFGSVNFTALTLPKQYRVYSITDYGNYLAISCTTPSGQSGAKSVVILWDRDESLATVSEIIPWGEGFLKVLNNLNGILVGVNVMSSGNASSVQDRDSVQIKAWAGGSVELLKEIVATRLTTTAPSCVLNERVNFIRNNRLYFSANVVGGGTAPAYYGLWSVGKNKEGRYAVTIERVATNDNTETGVFAAQIVGDFLCTVHTANGTLTATTNGNTLSAIYGATSIYESSVNQQMPIDDRNGNKQLVGVFASYLPLPTDGQVVMKYRVDSSANGAWTSIFTETTNGATLTETTVDSAGTNFTAGKKYEFRLESTGGAIITGWGYKYEPLGSSVL